MQSYRCKGSKNEPRIVFNKEPSAEALEAYLKQRDSFDEILMMLFSHGVDSIGLVSIADWRRILKRARKRGEFVVGVTERAYPRDFAVFVRYYFDLVRKIKSRYPPSSVTCASWTSSSLKRVVLTPSNGSDAKKTGRGSKMEDRESRT